MSRILVTVAFVLLVCGCKDREQSTEPAPAIEAEAVPAESGEGSAQPALPDAPAEPEAQAAAEPEAQAAAEPATAAQPEPAQPARDLGAELRVAVGSPADCVQDYRPAAARTIRINISAVVRPTGMIIEPSVSAAGLSARDRSCVAQRVGDVVLTPLGGERSEQVSTYVDVKYQPPAIEEADVGAPDPNLKDVVKSLPKKTPIAPSGVPIEGGNADPIEGPSGVPIEGPKGVPIEGPKPQPIDGY
jgi:hypothetical protein